jgi:hypothetical protein
MKTLKEFASQNSIGGPGSAPDGCERFANSYRVHMKQIVSSQGVALGWNLRTPSAF